MAVSVDRKPLSERQLGLSTVGDVLAHLQKQGRLVVQILIDGNEPDLAHLSTLKPQRLGGHTVFIETADPRQLALQVLDEIRHQLKDSDLARAQASALLEQNQLAKAMEQLGICFRVWQATQEAITKTAELMAVDLNQVTLNGQPIRQAIIDFATHLREVKTALEQRDYVMLNDILQYDTSLAAVHWDRIIVALRQSFDPLP